MSCTNVSQVLNCFEQHFSYNYNFFYYFTYMEEVQTNDVSTTVSNEEISETPISSDSSKKIHETKISGLKTF